LFANAHRKNRLDIKKNSLACSPGSTRRLFERVRLGNPSSNVPISLRASLSRKGVGTGLCTGVSCFKSDIITAALVCVARVTLLFFGPPKAAAPPPPPPPLCAPPERAPTKECTRTPLK
jgi:hypothetical protein